MRFPKVESIKWKCEIINGLINKGYNVSIKIFYSSYFDQLKFGYKYLSNLMFRHRNKLSTYTTVNNRKIKEYFREKIQTGSEERIKQTKSEGNQYFEMHPFFLNNVERYIKLKE